MRILVLSDGKAGHVKQSLALLELIREAGLASGKVEVVEEEVKQIRYKSPLHRHLFWLLTPLLNFFEQDREIFDFVNSLVAGIQNSVFSAHFFLLRRMD